MGDAYKDGLGASYKHKGVSTRWLSSLSVTFPSFFAITTNTTQVQQLGISNIYDLKALQKIFKEAEVKPAVVQNRWGLCSML